MKEIITAKPFVKWAGGKTQLLEEVQKSLPSRFTDMEKVTYVEPFVGGGAVLFWILQHHNNIDRAIINDINAELIDTYRSIRNEANVLISVLADIQSSFLSMPQDKRKDFYLDTRAGYNRHDGDSVLQSARFIFLNRTCFNGLYRVNRSGEFNVPFGKYANPKICDTDNLLAVSALLQKVEILCGDFSETAKYASTDTLYYIDPPYKPLTNTSVFTSYSKGGFDDAEQIRLRDFCQQIAGKGAFFIASNSDPAPDEADGNFFDRIYGQFHIKRVSASRMINSDAERRGKISEIMITNAG